MEETDEANETDENQTTDLNGPAKSPEICNAQKNF
jgi:hypothetical protein